MTRIRPREGLHPAVTKSEVCFDQSGSGDISEIMLLSNSTIFQSRQRSAIPDLNLECAGSAVCIALYIANNVIGGTRTCGFSRSPGSEREFVTLSVPCKVPRKFPISQPRLISRRNLMYASLQLSNLDYGRLHLDGCACMPSAPLFGWTDRHTGFSWSPCTDSPWLNWALPVCVGALLLLQTSSHSHFSP